MKYTNMLKEYGQKVLSFMFLFYIYASTYVYAQEQGGPTASGGSGSSTRAIGNLGEKTLQQLVADFILILGGYVLRIMLGLIILTFLYGLMKYMFKGQGSDTARTEGRKLMLWGIIGIFAVTSVWGLVAIFTNFVGHDSIVIPQFK